MSPLLINISNSDLQGPLAQFNTTSLTREDIKLLIQSINLHLGNAAFRRNCSMGPLILAGRCSKENSVRH